MQLKTTKLYIRGRSKTGTPSYGIALKRNELHELGLTDDQMSGAQLIVKTEPGKIEVTIGEK